MLNIFKKRNLELDVLNSKTAMQDFFLRFKKYKMSIPSVCIILFIILLSIIVPMLTGHKYDEIDWNLSSFPSGPNAQHLFGTDESGRDLLTRLFVGTRISLIIAISATMVSVSIGILYGSFAGYMGGFIDNIMMRIVDILYSVPSIMVYIIIAVVFPNPVTLFTVVAFFHWLTLARVVRGQTMSIKNTEFIDAAKSYSLPTYLIILKHVIPNLLGVIALQIVGMIPTFMFIDAVLSFIGLGIKEPLTSLGILLYTGSSSIEISPWIFLFPFSVFAALLICFNFLADATRDALDKKTK